MRLRDGDQVWWHSCERMWSTLEWASTECDVTNLHSGWDLDEHLSYYPSETVNMYSKRRIDFISRKVTFNA